MRRLSNKRLLQSRSASGSRASLAVTIFGAQQNRETLESGSGRNPLGGRCPDSRRNRITRGGGQPSLRLAVRRRPQFVRCSPPLPLARPRRYTPPLGVVRLPGDVAPILARLGCSAFVACRDFTSTFGLPIAEANEPSHVAADIDLKRHIIVSTDDIEIRGPTGFELPD